MLNSVAAGRRLARRTALAQAIATSLAAALCLPFGVRAALAASAGGAAMTLGSAIAAWGALPRQAQSAEMALGRLVLGIAVKWIVVAAGLYLAIAVWTLPAPPALAGAAAAAAGLLYIARAGSR